MILLGVLLLVVAAVLIALGVTNAAVSVLLWVGVGLVVVAAILLIANRSNLRR